MRWYKEGILYNYTLVKLSMKYFAGGNDDQNEDELQRVPEFMRGSAYLDRRQQQILESQLAINSLQRGIRNVMFDIAHLLAATPSAGNQAMLQRSFGELQGLANAITQTAAADSGANRGAGVDLTGTQAAIESRANSSGGDALKDGRDKKRESATKIKDLSAPDAVPAAEADQNAPATPATTAPSDTKPAAVTPGSNLDRFSKLAPEESRTQDDPAASAASDLPPLPNKRGSRSNVAALKLDHAEAVAKSDAPDRQVAAQGAEATAQAGSAPSAKPIHAAAVRKLPSPAGW
jgi:hypothetical protein